MAHIREFKGLRPKKDLVNQVAELPYDVISQPEAREIAARRPNSIIHVTKPEAVLPEGTDVHDDIVYQTGKRNLDALIDKKVLIQDKDPRFYLYTLVREGREQTGLVACVNIDDYINQVIKKHELTLEEKEIDRSKHIDILNAQTGLIYLFYREEGNKKSLFDEALAIKPEYDFTADDSIRHIVRVIDDEKMIRAFKREFIEETLYIADGHHRAAAAVRVGLSRRSGQSADTNRESNWFLSVIFPHNQLHILAYNRVVRDLNGRTAEEFLEVLAERFHVEKSGLSVPPKKGMYCMYMQNSWHILKPLFDIKNDPVESLDVSVLQNALLSPILGISDPRKDKRIDFIGGIKGTGRLEELVDSGEFSVAFSLYPTSINDLIRVSDAGGIMPPKSTWFEPKLRSGLIMHAIEPARPADNLA